MSSGDKEDPTVSSTDVAEDSPLPDYQSLLGSRNLRRSALGESMALIRLPQAAFNEDTRKALEAPIPHGPNDGHVEVILGPFSFEKIRAFLEQGILRPSDVMLKSFDRWKPCKVFFPDIPYGSFETLEDTRTPTDTVTLGEGTFEETPVNEILSEKNKNAPETSILEGLVERVEEIKEKILEVESGAHDSVGKSPMAAQPDEQSSSFEPLHSKDLFGDRFQSSEKPQQLRGRVDRTGGTDRRNLSGVRHVSVWRLSLKNGLLGIFTLLAILCVGLYVFFGISTGQNNLARQSNLSIQGEIDSDKLSYKSEINFDKENWPSDLKPITLEQLYEKGDGADRMVKNIRRIINDYRKTGARIFNRADEEFLLRQSQAGGSSPNAKVLAINSLAVHYLSQRNPAAAIRKLKPFVDDDSILDLSSLLNLGVSMYEGDFSYELAKPYLASALRKASEYPNMIFFPTSLNVLYQIRNKADLTASEVDSEFRTIEQKHSSSPIFYGLWIQALQRLKAPPKEKIQRLLLKALWGDPDRIFDSAFESIPIARQWFVAQSFDGLRDAALSAESKLTLGQKSFLDLMLISKGSTYEFRRIRSPKLLEILDQERLAHPLSGLLYAFLMKEDGKYSEALEALDLLFKDPNKNEMLLESSYAYAFAGELAIYLGRKNEAKIYFSNALNNPFEVLALWGMALLARENIVDGGGRASSEAEGKLAEAQSADRAFLPVLLRRERFSWHHSVETP